MKFFTPVIPSSNYRPDIDGLRAFSIVAVVLFHAFPSVLRGGFIGVDVFFVISGYLITLILLRKYGALNASGLSTFDLVKTGVIDFYARRIKRIFPALISLLFGVIIIGFFIQTAPEYKELGKQVVYGSLFGENIFLILKSGGYWDTATELKPLMHLWTLAVEEQYYIFYPLIFFACFKFKWGFGKSLLVLWISSFALNIFQYKVSPIVSFYSLHTRFWELCTGALLANLVYKEIPFLKTLSSRWIQETLSLVGLVMLVIGCVFINGNQGYYGWRALIPTIGGALLILSNESWVNRNLLSAKPIVFIGLISYTWYLWHWPFIAFARQIGGGVLPKTSYCLALTAIGFVCSLISYFFIEQPIRRKHVSRPLVLSLCFGVIASACVGGCIISNNGIVSRIPNPVLAEKVVITAPYTTKSCQKEYDYEGAFCLSTKKGTNTIGIIGDSHAYHLAPGFMACDKPFVILGQHGTPPLRGLVKPDQERTWRDGVVPNISKAYDRILNDPQIKTVILAARWNFMLNNKKLIWTNHKEIKDRRQLFRVLLREEIQDILASGKRVVIMKDNPRMGFEPEECFDSRPVSFLSQKREMCGISLKEAEKRSKAANKILDDVAKEFGDKVVLYDPKTVLCPDNFCWSVKDNDVMYRDADHLSDRGSSLVVSDLLSKHEF